MEENNNNGENINTEEKIKSNCLENHCLKKCLAMVLATFLGSFLAFYFVADQVINRAHPKPPFNPQRIEKKMFNDMDRMYRKDMHDFDKMFKEHKKLMPAVKPHEMPMPVFMSDSVKIRTDMDDNEYKIIIGLKPFQNDENKIRYSVNGRKMTVSGKSIVKDNDYEQDIAFSQDFILPPNADIKSIIKKVDDDKLEIIVPIKE